MDAVELINERLDVHELLYHFDFDNPNSSQGFVRACCKLHGGDNPTAFVIEEDTGMWYCHTGNCGGGDAFTLVQKLKDITFEESVKWLASFFDIDINGAVIKERKANYVRDLKNYVKAMQSHEDKPIKPYSIDADVKSVTKFRGFKQETLKLFNLGYVDKMEVKSNKGNNFNVNKRLVFPIYFMGVLVGVSLRKTIGTDKIKWIHQPTSLDTGNLLYNFEEAKGEHEIIITEGIPDVWAWHEVGKVAVCTFGAHLTDEQYRLLLRTGAKLIFAFDGDKAGREATLKMHKRFRYTADTEYIHFKDGEDSENVPREELLSYYETRSKRPYVS